MLELDFWVDTFSSSPSTGFEHLWQTTVKIKQKNEDFMENVYNSPDRTLYNELKSD